MIKHLVTACLTGTILLFDMVTVANEAKKAFEEGTVLYEKDQYAEAAEAFRKAHRLKPSWKILFNVGQCSAAAKQYGMALEAFEAYLSQGGDDVSHEKRQNVISEIKILREMVGYLDVQAPDGCTVLVDDYKRGTTPIPGPIPVGSGINHELEVVQAGLDVLKKTIRVNSGQTITVNAGQQESSETTDSPEDDPSTNDVSPSGTEETSYDVEDDTRTKNMTPLRIAGVSTLGVGLGTLGGALYTGLKTKTLSDKLNKKQCFGSICDAETDEMKKYQLITNVLIGVGGTLVVAGATMLIFSYVAGSSRNVPETNNEDIGVVPAIGPQSASLLLNYNF